MYISYLGKSLLIAFSLVHFLKFWRRSTEDAHVSERMASKTRSDVA